MNIVDVFFVKLKQTGGRRKKMAGAICSNEGCENPACSCDPCECTAESRCVCCEMWDGE